MHLGNVEGVGVFEQHTLHSAHLTFTDANTVTKHQIKGTHSQPASL